MYKLIFAPQALEDLSKLKKSEPAAFKKGREIISGVTGTSSNGNWKTGATQR